jgi:hypothetical protein
MTGAALAMASSYVPIYFARHNPVNALAGESRIGYVFQGFITPRTVLIHESYQKQGWLMRCGVTEPISTTYFGWGLVEAVSAISCIF